MKENLSNYDRTTNAAAAEERFGQKTGGIIGNQVL